MVPVDVPATRATSVIRVAGRPRSTMARQAASRIASRRAGWRGSWPGGRPGPRGGDVDDVRVDTGSGRDYNLRVNQRNSRRAPGRRGSVRKLVWFAPVAIVALAFA